MTLGYRTIVAVFVAIAWQVSVSEAGDTEIWPIPTKCPEVDPLEYTVHLQHEWDCTKFYKCDHGGKVLFDCPGGLEFSPVLQVCVWPYEANCTLAGSTAKPTGSTTKPTKSTPKPTESTTKPTKPTKVPEPTPKPTKSTPKPTESTPKPTKSTPKPTRSTPKPTESTPKPTESTPKPTKSTPKPTKPTKIPEPTKTKPTKPLPPRDPDCPWPDPLNYTVHLPHKNCSKFYKCDHGAKVEFDCPDGLHFNPKLEVCDWPSDAGCEDDGGKTTSEKPTGKPTKPTNSTEKPTKPTEKPTRPTNSTIKPTKPTEKPTRPTNSTEKPTRPTNSTEKPTRPTNSTEKPTKPSNTTTSPPNTLPPKDPDCPWPDPLNYTVHLPHKNCSKFYKCDHGAKVEFDCPDGLHFNPKLEVCDWPSKAGCEDDGGKTTSEKPTGKPTKPTNSTEKPTKPTEKPTRPTNSTIKPTKPTEKPTRPTNSTAKPTRPTNSTEKPTRPTNSTEKPTKPSNTTTSPPNTLPPRDPDCPWPDPLNYTVHLPHKNCSKFYKCDHGAKVEFDCPEGLHFNPKLEVCDWPSAAGCKDDGGKTTTEKPTGKPTKPTNSTEKPTKPTGKPTRPTNSTIKPTKPTEKPTRPTNSTEKPTRPTNSTEKPTRPTNSTEKPTKPSNTTTSPPNTLPPRDPDCPWPDPLNYTVHLPHEDCSKFYKCDHGAKVEFDCPEGLHFNPKLEVCDWPSAAGCKDDGGKTTSEKPTRPTNSTEKPTKPTEKPTRPSNTTTSPPNTLPPRDPDCPWPDPLNYTVHLPHEDDCSKFYKCDHGAKVEFDCPAGLHFNAELEVCDWPKNAGCESIPTEPCDETTTSASTPDDSGSGGDNTTDDSLPPRDPDCPWPDPLNYTVHLPHDDCSKFYKCDHGAKVEFDCPEGLHFNPVSEVCDWPRNAGCEDWDGDDDTTTTATWITTPTTPSSGSCPETECQDSTIYLPVLSNPRKYRRCVRGVEIIETCPGPLVFDENLATCNLEHLIEPAVFG